jgi:hypothetical protein
MVAEAGAPRWVPSGGSLWPHTKQCPHPLACSLKPSEDGHLGHWSPSGSFCLVIMVYSPRNLYENYTPLSPSCQAFSFAALVDVQSHAYVHEVYQSND